MVYVYQSDVSSLARNVKNDVAIIYLKTPYELNDHIKPACLPKTQPVHGSTCYASGWGNMIRNQDGKAESPDNLMTAPLKILNKTECYQEIVKETREIKNETFEFMYNELGPGGICTSNRPKSVCQGDSGGPFICEENGKAVVHGIASAMFDFGTSISSISSSEFFAPSNLGHNFSF